jgi:hypothetical protein
MATQRRRHYASFVSTDALYEGDLTRAKPCVWRRAHYVRPGRDCLLRTEEHLNGCDVCLLLDIS